MFSWCNNRLEITAKSVCIDVMQAWIAGTETPRYRHTIRQAIKLFLAGCAGILKPTKVTEYAAYPLLTASGVGSSVPSNVAFQHFLELLGRDAWLDSQVISRIYHQSGVDTLKWESIPLSTRQVMAQLMAIHYADWFGIAGAGGTFDPDERWNWLGIMPETTCPCDMLMIMSSRLATELNGNSGLFRALNTTSELYMQLFGMEFPSGHHASWSRETMNTIVLTFVSPWYPPSGEVMGEMSQLFDCEIRHYWSSPDVGSFGYNCFEQGDHVDSGPYPENVSGLKPEGGSGERMYLVTDSTSVAASPATTNEYGSVRA